MTNSPDLHLETCALCHGDGPLCESHIIPSFVFDWLRESSATGYIRVGIAPNRRVQDGPKARLLCAHCEARLSVWEKKTAECLFKPYHRDTSTVVAYESWLVKFCASVSWRVLFVYRVSGLRNFSADQLALVDQALAVWSDLMFDRVTNPGEFELHLLPLDVIEAAEGCDLPPNMNRYLARAVQMDAVRSPSSAFVYAKMCKIVVLGFMQMRDPRKWQGTRVAIKRGTLKSGSSVVPVGFCQFLIDCARGMSRMQAALSKRQKTKIAETMRADIDRTAQSESFTAVSYDVEMFGDRAFDEPEE